MADEEGPAFLVWRGWWADLTAEPTRKQKDKAPRCISRSGVARTVHEYADDICLWCDKKRQGGNL